MAVTEAMTSVTKATSHYAVRLAVNKLSMHFMAENCVDPEGGVTGESSRDLARKVFYSCDWRTAFERCSLSIMKRISSVIRTYIHFIFNKLAISLHIAYLLGISPYFRRVPTMIDSSAIF